MEFDPYAALYGRLPADAVAHCDSTRPRTSRVRGYLWGSKDAYEADCFVAEKVVEVYPTAARAVISSRRFQTQATQALALDGICQFLDLGAGFAPPVHAAARDQFPDSRTVRTLYIDLDSVVLVHGRAQCCYGDRNYRPLPTDVVLWAKADITDPKQVLACAGLMLDLREPVAVSLVGVAEHIVDQELAVGTVRTIMDALSPGSALVMTNAANDYRPDVMDNLSRIYQGHGAIDYRARGRDEFAEFFGGLLIERPGIVSPHRWPEVAGSSDAPNVDADISCHAAVGRKP